MVWKAPVRLVVRVEFQRSGVILQDGKCISLARKEGDGGGDIRTLETL